MYGFFGFADSPRPWLMMSVSCATVSVLPAEVSAGTSGETPPWPSRRGTARTRTGRRRARRPRPSGRPAKRTKPSSSWRRCPSCSCSGRRRSRPARRQRAIAGRRPRRPQPGSAGSSRAIVARGPVAGQGEEVNARETFEREALGRAGRDVEQEPRPLPTLVLVAVAVEGQPAISPSRRSSGPSSRSPLRRQIGELPSQQPPDCTNMSGPKVAFSRSSTATAASVASMVLCHLGAPQNSPSGLGS